MRITTASLSTPFTQVTKWETFDHPDPCDSTNDEQPGSNWATSTFLSRPVGMAGEAFPASERPNVDPIDFWHEPTGHIVVPTGHIVVPAGNIVVPAHTTYHWE